MSFTGKSVPKGISLPTDMWARLEAIREEFGVPVSTQIQHALERDWGCREAKPPLDSQPVLNSTYDAS